MSTAVQFIAGEGIHPQHQYMGMVRQWQQLLHGNRISHSYTESRDFVKLAEGLWRRRHPLRQAADLDDAIMAMLNAADKPVLFGLPRKRARQPLS